jgi:hypothetical protein
MKSILLFSLIMTINTPILLYKSTDSSQVWNVIDDVVMGGVSQSSVSYSKEGYTKFKGNVSTAYNGGFSSMRLRFKTVNIEDAQTVVLRIKGDGKRYQFRLKEQCRDAYSFIYYFETNGNWQTIEIPLKEVNASYRGRMLPNISFSNSTLEEIGILIGNKTNESFELLIEAIYLK